MIRSDPLRLLTLLPVACKYPYADKETLFNSADGVPLGCKYLWHEELPLMNAYLFDSF